MARQSDDNTSADELIGDIIARNRSEILDEYEKLLAQSATPSISRPSISRNSPSLLRAQAEAVLDDLYDWLLAREQVRPERERLGVAVASAGAGPDVHLGELLRAAGVLCEAVLNAIAERVPERPEMTRALLRLAVTLHQGIVGRLAIGALGYLRHVLERPHPSRAHQRRAAAPAR